MMIQAAGAFITVFFFSILLETPKRYIVWTGVIGGIGWFFYLLFDKMGWGTILSSFLSVLVTGTLSHISARKYKAPVTLFLIAGILPTVPGAGMYRIVYNMIIRNSEMANFYFTETIEAAGAISFAVVIVDTVFRLIQRSIVNRQMINS